MPDAPIKKKYLRAEVLALRDAVDAGVWSAADACIRANVLALPAYQAAQTVFCYISVGSEVDTLWLIEEMLASGKTVCVPRCEAKGVMHAYAITSLDELEEGVLGIPTASKTSELIAPDAIDFAVVPCVACDRSGSRLGYGGGYYDRYLAIASRATKAILCREGLLVASLPSEEHDVLADIIITDKEVITLS